MCVQQLYSQCETTQVRQHGKGAALFGYTKLYGQVPGGQAELLRVPQAQFGPIKVPAGPPDERFVYLSDVLPTAWQAVEHAAVPKGGTVAVFGLGPIGQMCCRIALHRGPLRCSVSTSSRSDSSIAVSGPDSCRLAGSKADLMVAVEPKPELGEMFDAAGGSGKPRVGQVAVAYDADRDAAVERAHAQFRWFGLGWKVNADLPNPDSFEGATQFVTPQQVAESLACGPDVDEHVEKIKPYLDAGFTEVALVQIGAEHQEQFTSWAERELLPALRSL